MKLTLTLFLIALFSVSIAAQNDSVEKNFAQNIKKFKVEKYSMGEDATSGFDYLIYKNKTGIVKIRVIWSSSISPARVEDLYYKAGVPVFYASLSVTNRQLNRAIKGTLVTLPAVERCWFTDSKMVKWTEKGKAVAADDKRWADKEKDTLANAVDTLESYPTLKELQ